MDLVESQKRGEGNAPAARHPWELARFEVVQDLLQGIIEDRDGYTVLDIGCGDVFFVGSMARRYPKVSFYAVDSAFDEKLISSLSKQVEGLRIKLFKSLDEAVKAMTGKADLVLLLDVVEHIADDKGFLASLRDNRAIGHHTRVLITVPAFQGLFCSHDEFLGHFRRYNNRSLEAVARASGFSPERSGYFFSALLLPRAVQVLREKLRRRSEATTGLVEWKGGTVVTNLFKGILYADFRVTRLLSRIGLKLPGLSNYMVCRKSA